MSDPHAKLSTGLKRPRLALEFSAEAIALYGHAADGSWIKARAVQVNASDLNSAMASMRDEAAELAYASPPPVDLWLPEDQIANHELDLPPHTVLSRQKAARYALKVEAGVDPETLHVDCARHGRAFAVSSVGVDVVDEARRFARAHGFDPRRVTTRYGHPAFAKGPTYAGGRSQAPFIAGGVVAAALGAVALGIFAITEPPARSVDGSDRPRIAAAEPAPVLEPRSPGGEEPPASGQKPPFPLEEPAEFASVEPAPPQSAPSAPRLTLIAPIASEIERESASLASPNAVVAEMAPPPPPVLLALLPVAAGGLEERAVEEPDEPAFEAFFFRDYQVARIVATSPNPIELSPGAPVRAVSIEPIADDPPPQPPALVALEPPAADPTDPSAAAEDEPSVEPDLRITMLRPPPGSTRMIADPDDPRGDQTAPPDTVASPSPEAEIPTPVEPDSEPPRGEAEQEPSEPEEPVIAAPDVPASPPEPTPAEDTPPQPEVASPPEVALEDLPGPGAPSAAPPPSARPDKLDTTPSALALARAPSPSVRPRSIRQRPPPSTIGSTGAVVVRAPSRGPPAGPGVANAATLRDAIQLEEMNLLGVFGGTGQRRALIRMPSGDIVRATRGSQLDGWTVSRIDASSLRITRGGETRTLNLTR